MAETMQLDLVSPEKRLASLAVSEVEIPGADGDMTVMQGHAPMITTLRPGVVKARGKDGSVDYVVTGGFAEVTAEGVSVLAERALPVAEMTQDILEEMLREASATDGETSTEALDIVAKRAADLSAMATSIGLTARI